MFFNYQINTTIKILNREYIMCIVCNITQNEFIETALAVENVFDGEYMTIPLTTTPEQIHSFEVIQSMLLNANLIALIF